MKCKLCQDKGYTVREWVIAGNLYYWFDECFCKVMRETFETSKQLWVDSLDDGLIPLTHGRTSNSPQESSEQEAAPGLEG